MNTNKDSLAEEGLEPVVICKISQEIETTDFATTDLMTTDEVSTDGTYTMITGTDVTGLVYQSNCK